MRLPALLPTLLLVASQVAAVEPAHVTVRQTDSAVRAGTESLAVTVHRRQFGLVARGRGVGTLLRDQGDGALFCERDGVRHGLGEVTAATARLADGVQLDVATDEGTPATVTSASSRVVRRGWRSIRPNAAGVAAARRRAGARRRSERHLRAHRAPARLAAAGPPA